MHVALTGASGFIGSEIVRQLQENGHTVTALVRQTSRRDHIEPFVDRFVVGDQDDESCWPDLLNGADAVVHNSVDWKPLHEERFAHHLQTNLLGSLKLLEAARPRQFVFMSTIAVHHDMRPRWNGFIDEDHPLRPSLVYGAYKAAVEPHLWSAHYSWDMHTCAIRPCGVYGVDPNLDRSYGYKLIKKMMAIHESGSDETIDKPGGGKFVHVEDVAATVVATLGNPDAAGQAYNLVDCYARWADWAVIINEELGLDVPVDLSSPSEPKNKFSKEAVQSLGVQMDRGLDGMREVVRELIEIVNEEQRATAGG